jgi:hypothetical protein
MLTAAGSVLWHVIWVQGLHFSGAYEVRRLVTRVMWPQENVTVQMAPGPALLA